MIFNLIASDIGDKLLLGAQTTLIGLGVVFLMLFILVGVLKIFEKIFYQKKAEVEATLPEAEAAPATDEQEIQAAIMATLNVVLSEEASENGTDTKYAVKSIRKI